DRFSSPPPLPHTPTVLPYTTLFRSEHTRHPIGELLDRRLGGLCVLDQLDDLTERGVLTDPRGAKRHAARGIEGRADHLVATLNTDRKSTRLNSSHQIISYAVFCLKN